MPNEEEGLRGEGREVIDVSEIAETTLPYNAKIRLMEARAGVILCYIVINLLAIVLVGIMIYFFASMRHLKLTDLTAESL